MRMENAEWGLERLQGRGGHGHHHTQRQAARGRPEAVAERGVQGRGRGPHESDQGPDRGHHEAGPGQPGLQRCQDDHEGRRRGDDRARGDRRARRRRGSRRPSTWRSTRPCSRSTSARPTGVLIDVIGGTDMTISEAEKAAEEIQARVGPNARIIWGAAIDPTMDKTVQGHDRRDGGQVEADPRQAHRIASTRASARSTWSAERAWPLRNV